MRREQPNGLNGKRKREKNYGKEYRFHWRETLYQFCTFFKNLKNLGLRWVFTAAHGWLSVVVSGATFHPGARASRCCGFSCAPGGAQVLRERALVVVVQGLSCPVACGIFLDQRSNLCPLHLQVNSQPLYHQGSPVLYFFFFFEKKVPGAREPLITSLSIRLPGTLPPHMNDLCSLHPGRSVEGSRRVSFKPRPQPVWHHQGGLGVERQAQRAPWTRSAHATPQRVQSGPGIWQQEFLSVSQHSRVLVTRWSFVALG